MKVALKAWGTTLLGTGLYFSFTYTWNSLAALIPAVSDGLGLSGVATGIVLGTVALTIFCTWPIVGPLVERTGPTRAMGIGVLGLGLAGMSRAYVDSFPGLVVAMVVVSLGGSTVTYGLPSIVSSWFDDDRSGTPLGVVTVGATLGTVVAFNTATTAVSMVGGWRPALFVSGIPAVVLGLLWVAVGRAGPHREGDASVPTVGELPALLRRPEVATLVAAGTLYLFATHSVYGWLSPLLIGRGVAAATATQLVAVLTAGMIVGGLLVPALADRLGNHALFIGGAGTVFAGCVAGLATLPPTGLALAATSFCAGVGVGGISPLLRTLPLKLVPSGTVSTVLGMIFGLGAVGGFVGPVFIGIAQSIEVGGLGFVLIGAPGVGFVGIGLLITSRRGAD